MGLFTRSKTKEEVVTAVDKAVKGADVEMQKNTLQSTRDQIEVSVSNMPTLAAGVAAAEVVIDAGKAIAETAKSAVIDFATPAPAVNDTDYEIPGM
jgi:hypothetical protein